MDRELQFAGEYKLLSLKIQPPENPAVDLSGIVVQIEIIEDIEEYRRIVRILELSKNI